MRSDIEPRQPKATTDSIRAFRKGYRLVHRQSRMDGSLGRVEVSVLAFAVEKALKAVLYYWDARSAEDIRRKGGHDLLKLYELFADDTKALAFLLSGAFPHRLAAALETTLGPLRRGGTSRRSLATKSQ
jgi:hypothetical protein